MALVVAVFSAMAITGCRAGAIERENDRLRDRAVELEQRNQELAGINAELRSQVEQASRAVQSVPPEVVAATPRVVEITIGRLSHARDDDGDGVADGLRLYVHPADGLGRFTQLVGTIEVNAAVLPARDEARTIGRLSLEPQQVRQAYRSTFMGTHYVVTVPLELSGTSRLPRECIVRVEYTDAYSGMALSSERTIKLDQPRR